MNEFLKDVDEKTLKDAETEAKLQVMAWDGVNDRNYKVWKTLLDMIREELERRK